MAPPKSTQEKKRKTTRGSSRSQPSEAQEKNLVLNYDQNRFISKANSDRLHQNIMGRALLPERRNELKPGEYDHIQEELEKRKWNFVLADLPDEIDEVLVKEFYANAWEPDLSQPHSGVSKVRGKLVRYDRRSLNRILNTLMFQSCPLGAFMSNYPDHDLIASTLCLPRYGYQLGTSGTPVRILRKHLNSLATIWSIFTFTNICPNSHTSDINLERSYMVYGIMTGIDMDVGAYISQEIALIADKDSYKLGFPALVIAVCKASGVTGVFEITLKLQPPLNKKYFDRNCTNRGEFFGMNAPPPVPLPRRNVRAARPPVVPSVPSPDLFTRYIQSESGWGSAYPGALEPELDEQEDMMAGDGDEEEEKPDPRWTQQSYHSQESQWRSRADGYVILEDDDMYVCGGCASKIFICVYEYDQIRAFMSSYPDHDLIASTLCLPGYGYQLGTSGTPWRIFRKHLNSLATIWSIFKFTNICPNSHTSDINLEMSYMVYGIMTGIDMDVGAYISQEIALIADNDSCKLGFPALVTALCKASGVAGVSKITFKLQPPLNKKFFDRNCTNRGEFSSMNAPPPVPPPRRNVRNARPPVAPSVPSPDLFTRYIQ
ncbi:hypothetical protein LR48_Vigan08g074700 [Vigna angularis]|uniref:Putative plant transposon protein domain-containing protein n=1 Tax=Phaseolus angularis TaxID=3914 RepID=A0A0L9V4D3_PHAAN|nr:hypothetical protein LR48_Vigan08g074700 [Vigna angularis]